MASVRSQVIGGFFFVFAASVALVFMLWYKHHDASVKGYSDGSVCSHAFNIDNAYNFSVAQHEAASKPEDFENDDGNQAMYEGAAQDAAGTVGGERTEFQDILSSLIAANEALVAKKEKPLFCSPDFTQAERFGLYDSYWAATKQRIKQDLTVCRRDFPTDVLIFYSQAYPCR